MEFWNVTPMHPFPAHLLTAAAADDQGVVAREGVVTLVTLPWQYTYVAACLKGSINPKTSEFEPMK